MMASVDEKLAYLEREYDMGHVAGYLNVPVEDGSAIFMDGYADGKDDRVKSQMEV